MGEIGEMRVKKKLGKLNKGKYMVLNNITVPYKEGVTQIDHIVISNFGVIVIETKNYKGVIYGDKLDDFWHKICYGM